MRLDKFLAEAGLGSRKEVKQLIKKGVITVNAQVEKRIRLRLNLSQIR